MQPNRLDNLLAHRHHGIETCGGLLKDHRDAVASYGLHLSFGELHQIRAVKHHFTLSNGKTVGKQAHQRKRCERLAATRFTHECKTFSRSDRKRHIFDGSERLWAVDSHTQIFDVENFCHRRSLRPAAGISRIKRIAHAGGKQIGREHQRHHKDKACRQIPPNHRRAAHLGSRRIDHGAK